MYLYISCSVILVRYLCMSLHPVVTLDMASRSGAVQRPNGIPREKICQFKLVLLGK